MIATIFYLFQEYSHLSLVSNPISYPIVPENRAPRNPQPEFCSSFQWPKTARILDLNIKKHQKTHVAKLQDTSYTPSFLLFPLTSQLLG